MYKWLDKIRREQRGTVMKCRRMTDRTVKSANNILELLRRHAAKR